MYDKLVQVWRVVSVTSARAPFDETRSELA
jgi:hypothetical protein